MPTLLTHRWTRIAADVGLWVAIGVVMAFLGPFGSSERSLYERLVYWELCMVGGGVIGIAIDTPVRKLAPGFWARLITVSVLMTPPVTGLVALVNHWLGGMRLGPANIAAPWFQVFIVCCAAMCLRQLAWAEPPAAAPAQPQADPLAAFLSVGVAIFSYRLLAPGAPLVSPDILGNLFARPWLFVHAAGATTKLGIHEIQAVSR